MHDVTKRGLALAVATGGLLITGAAPAVSAVSSHPENPEHTGTTSQPTGGSSHHAAIPVSGLKVTHYTGRHKAHEQHAAAPHHADASHAPASHHGSEPHHTAASHPAASHHTAASQHADTTPHRAPAKAPAKVPTSGAAAQRPASGTDAQRPASGVDTQRPASGIDTQRPANPGDAGGAQAVTSNLGSGLPTGGSVETPAGTRADSPVYTCSAIVTVLGGGDRAAYEPCANGGGNYVVSGLGDHGDRRDPRDRPHHGHAPSWDRWVGTPAAAPVVGNTAVPTATTVADNTGQPSQTAGTSQTASTDQTGQTGIVGGLVGQDSADTTPQVCDIGAGMENSWTGDTGCTNAPPPAPCGCFPPPPPPCDCFPPPPPPPPVVPPHHCHHHHHPQPGGEHSHRHHQCHHGDHRDHGDHGDHRQQGRPEEHEGHGEEIGQLPHTGTDVLDYAGIAAGAMALGAGALIAARRRPGSAS